MVSVAAASVGAATSAGVRTVGMAVTGAAAAVGAPYLARIAALSVTDGVSFVED